MLSLRYLYSQQHTSFKQHKLCLTAAPAAAATGKSVYHIESCGRAGGHVSWVQQGAHSRVARVRGWSFPPLRPLVHSYLQLLTQLYFKFEIILFSFFGNESIADDRLLLRCIGLDLRD